MKTYYIIFMLLGVVVLLACGSGDIPTATDPLIELEAAYVTTRPVLDGKANDKEWEMAEPYILHVQQAQSSEGFNITLKAVWWMEWTKTTNQWIEKPFWALLVNWPDDDKNIDPKMWEYNPADSTWAMNDNMSDWMLISWLAAGTFNDIWYWDAAITNPLGYAEDRYYEVFQLTDTTTFIDLRIDGLNQSNDTAEQQNTWDFNYDDNRTPDDPSDDRPLWAWKVDPDSVPPALPRVVSSEDERRMFLLRDEADLLKNTPYASPSKAVKVPAFVLEEPKDQPADILAAGNWDGGSESWTVELARTASTDQGNDATFNPEDRYYRQPFYLTVGDNTETLDEIVALYTVVLTFEFVP